MRNRSDRAAIWLGLALILASASAGAQAPSTPGDGGDEAGVAALRQKFQVGMEHYKAGAYADAILVWQSVYRTLGREKGYRLAFNLARAYDALGDATRAAERYEAYVAEVKRRREAGETLEEAVVSQETDATRRLEDLGASRGRLHVVSPDRPLEASVDGGEPRLAGFTAYVLPGKHVVTFGAGKDARRVEVDVSAGARIEVAPPAPALPPRPAPRVTPPPPPAPRLVTRTERPFPSYILLIGAGVTAASLVVPALTYSRATGVFDEHEASRDPDERTRLANDYFSARSTAYASLAVPATLGAVTLGLAAFYFFGASERLVPVGGAGPTGATLGLRGAF